MVRITTECPGKLPREAVRSPALGKTCSYVEISSALSRRLDKMNPRNPFQTSCSMIQIQKDLIYFLGNISFIKLFPWPLPQHKNWEKENNTCENCLAGFFIYLFKSVNQILIHYFNSVEHNQVLSGKSNIETQTKKIVLHVIHKVELKQIVQSSNKNSDNTIKWRKVVFASVGSPQLVLLYGSRCLTSKKIL